MGATWEDSVMISGLALVQSKRDMTHEEFGEFCKAVEALPHLEHQWVAVNSISRLERASWVAPMIGETSPGRGEGRG